MNLKQAILLAVLASISSTASATTITAAEYFFNSDPGHGNGTAVNVPAPGNSVNFQVSVPPSTLAALPDGTHRLNVRVRNNSGRWSQAPTRLLYKSAASASTTAPDIVAAEYFLNEDPGQGNGISIPVTSSSPAIDITVTIPAATIAALPDGTHTLITRVQDASGKWSNAVTRLFYKSPPPPPGTPLASRIEYQWFFNGSPASAVFDLTPPNPANPINFQELAPLSGLLEGETYQLVFTPYDENDKRGISVTHQVLIQTTDSNGDGIPDQWKLTYGFGIMDDIAGIDSDGDGLTNLEEFLAGTNPREMDTSGDGISDGLAIQLAALGFDPLVNNPDLVAALGIYTEEGGLFTAEQLQALALGAPVLSRDSSTGEFTLRIRLEKSTDLETFTAFDFESPGTTINTDGEIEFTFTSSDNAAFFRIEGK